MIWKNRFGSKAFIILLTLLLITGTLSFVSASTEATEIEDSISGTDQTDELKNKTFYMEGIRDAVSIGGRTTKEIYNTTYPERRGNKTELTEFRELIDWYLFPELAGDLRLNGTSTLSVWGRAREESPPSATFGYELWEVNETDEELIEMDDISHNLDTEWSTYEISFDIEETYTVSEGSSLRVTFDIWGDSENAYQIAFGGHVEDEEGNDFMADTNVTLPCLDYMRVSDVHTEDHEGEKRDLFDPEAQNKNISIHASVTNPFGGYDIEWVNITLEGPEETIFESHSMDQTYGYFDSYQSSYKYFWNYTDMLEGVYNITVRAVDKNGMIAYERTGEFQNHDEHEEHAFVIGGLDHYINLRLRDDQGELLTNSKVNLKINENVTFLSNETDEEGIVNFTVAEANYMITVDWQDTEVSTNRTIDVRETGDIDREDPFELTAGIYYTSVQILDREDQPVEDANVYMSHPNGTTAIEPMVSGDEGEILMERYPEGDYSFQIDWKGRNVGEFDLEIDGSDTHTLEVDIYHLDVSIEDREGDPINNALMISSYEDTRIAAESILSDQEGEIEMRLPATEYYFEVLWNDASVYQGTYELDQTGSIKLTTDIFTVTVQTQDDLGEELSGASIDAVYERTNKDIASAETDENGEAEFQLAAGEHTFEVSWLDIDVADESFMVDEDSTHFEVSTDVYRLQTTVVDSEDEILKNAELRVEHQDELVLTDTTNINGEATLKLPEAVFNFQITWRDTNVGKHSVEVTEGEQETTLEADVHHLDVEIEDVEGARVTLMKDNEPIMTERTDENGEVSFGQVAEGEYELQARLVTTQHWTSVDVETSEQISVQESGQYSMEFEDYPIPIYTTNLFFLILGLVVIIAAGGIAIAKNKEVL